MELNIDRFQSGPITIKMLASFVVIISCTLSLWLIWGRPTRKPDWWRFKRTVDALMESWQPIILAGTANNPVLSLEAKLSWFKDVQDKLASQDENPVLLADDDLLTHWRRAEYSAKTRMQLVESAHAGKVWNLNTQTAQSPNADDSFRMFANDIVRQIQYIWVEAIFNSTEPGAPGRLTPKTSIP